MKARMTEGAVAPMLIRLTLPMIIGVLGMVAFNLVDTFFVGQLGTLELAAMSFTFPVVLIVSSISMGLGIGMSSMVSQAIGRGDRHDVQRLTTDGLALALLIAFAIMLLGLLTMEPLFALLGATPDIVPLISDYMTIWYLGIPFMIIPMVGNNAIRATGDTTTPSMVMMVVVFVNIILDPLLIFGIGPFPRLELAGAAIATVIARMMTMLVAGWILIVRDKMVTFERPDLKRVLSSWRTMTYVGLPAAATNLIMPVSLVVMTRLVAGYGATAIAAFGAASRVDMVSMIVTMALSSVLSPFVGQNWGAKRRDRVLQGITYSHTFAIGWGLLLFLLLLPTAPLVASLFSDNQEVIAIMSHYLWIVPLGYSGQAVLLLSNSVFNALGRPLHAASLTLTQMLVLYIPLAFIGSALIGLDGIFGAALIANTLSGTAAFFWLRREAGKRVQQPATEQEPPVLASTLS
ncbi:MAG: MATE family efflux transporter [Chloroflexaceae bacterium]|nr:MATE family efflux transporter [Chloroflexaceae bacterium]